MSRAFRVPLFPRWVRWGGVFAVAAGIFYFSIVIAPPEPVLPKPEFVPLDKWRHFLAYGLLGVSLAYAITDADVASRWKAIAVFGTVMAYGLGIESGQSTLPHRYFGLGDALANAIGAGLSLLWYGLEPRLRYVRVFDGESTSPR